HLEPGAVRQPGDPRVLGNEEGPVLTDRTLLRSGGGVNSRKPPWPSAASGDDVHRDPHHVGGAPVLGGVDEDLEDGPGRHSVGRLDEDLALAPATGATRGG